MSSGSSRLANAVEPTRSRNTTVTGRRSIGAPLAGAGGTGTAPASAPLGLSAAAAARKRRRWPRESPSATRSASVMSGATTRSRSCAVNNGSYCCKPIPASHSAKVTIPATVARRHGSRNGARGGDHSWRRRQCGTVVARLGRDAASATDTCAPASPHDSPLLWMASGDARNRMAPHQAKESSMRKLLMCAGVVLALCVATSGVAQTRYSTGAVSNYPANPCFGPNLPFSVGSAASFRGWYALAGLPNVSRWENNDVWGSDFRDGASADNEPQGGSDLPDVYFYNGHGICQ